jgi:SAM-dependent methyltransferase
MPQRRLSTITWGRQIGSSRLGRAQTEEAHVTEFAPGLHARAGVEVNTSAYERFTGRWSRLFVPSVIAAAGVRSGGMVLDISTGTGEAAVALLPVIGPSGALVGADISLEMVQSAVRCVSDSRFLPIAADGQELPFRSGSFDAVVCQLGLQFFRSRRAAFPSSDAKVQDLFSGAGFTNVRLTHESRVGSMKSLNEYWESVHAGIGSIPQSYLLLEDRQRQVVREDVNAKLAPFMVGGELHTPIEMLICHGEAPPANDQSTRADDVGGPDADDGRH